MDIIQTITQITEYVAAAIVGLLALDNAVDALAKLFGNKEIDTLCGKIALYLGNLYAKIKPSATTVLPPAASGTTSTPPTTGA